MLGILSDQSLPLPILLDTVRHAETGHLSLDQARNARSRAGAIGPYQFLERYLPEFGYGMPTNIPVADVQDPTRSRELANQYITGFSIHHGFKTPLQKLVAYNRGPNFAADWVANGEKIEDLPEETKSYIRRAAEYLQNLGNNDMAYLSMPSEDDPNRTIDGQVIDPVAEAIRRAGVAASYPPSRYMDPRLRQQRPAITMPSEDDATVNVDGSQVGEDAILNQVGQSLTGVLTDITGANSQPRSAPPPPALSVYPNQMGITAPALASTQSPALTYNSTPQSRPTGTGQVSQNRRDRSVMSMVPPPSARIGLNEALIRIGGAGVRGSAQGGLEAIGAMTDAYGDIQDFNRKNALEIYKAQMKSAGKKQGSGAASSGAAIVNDDIGRALQLLTDDNEGFFTNLFQGDLLPATGFGAYLSALPNTDAKSLSNKLRTIQANISFDKLQAMREASPTGGALGQVSTFELQNLMAVFGSLDQSQSNEELQYNLRRLQQVYNDIVHGPGNHPYGSFASGGQPPGVASSNLNAARAIVSGQP